MNKHCVVLGAHSNSPSAFPVLSLVCAFPAGPMTRPELVRGGRVKERGAELVRVNNRVLMVSLACAEKPPPHRLKKQTSAMRTNLFKMKHFPYL